MALRQNPSGTHKCLSPMQAAAAITASTSLAAATTYDMRGREAIRFRPVVTAGNGDTNNYYKLQAYGARSRNGVFVQIPELISGKLYGTTPLTTDVFPAVADKADLTLPPFIRLVWVLTGTCTLTGYCEMDYRRVREVAPGRGSLGDTARLDS